MTCRRIIGKKNAPQQTRGAEVKDQKKEFEQIKIDEIGYLEHTIKRMVEELKQQGCLGEDFVFLTRAEQRLALERNIDQFIRSL